MINRALNIILVGWLVNALIFFHPVFGDHNCVRAQSYDQVSNHNDNTILDVVLNHCLANKGHKKDSQRKFFIKARYVSARSFNIDFLLPQSNIVNLTNQVQRLCFSRFKFWERKVFLPPHHNFLFRLSPF